MPGVGFEPTPPLGDQKTQTLRLKPSLNQLMILIELNRTLGHQDHVHTIPIQLRLIQSSSNFDSFKTSSSLLTENTA